MTATARFSECSLCVVGNINRDVQVQGVPAGTPLLADGETSVARVCETVGGGGANSACAAAALGARVHFAGKVGGDALAERLRQALTRHGVHTHLTVDPACATGTTVALEFADGQRHFLSCLPNNQSVTFQDLDLAALHGCTHLLRADIWFSESMLEEGNEQLLMEARRRQITTSLDINFDPCWSGAASGAAIAHRIQLVRKLLPMVDLAHGNTAELCRFTDSPDLNTALARLTDWGVGAVVVHMGRQGAGFYRGGTLTVEPPAWASTAVHATGTGDVLSVCMIALHDCHELSVGEKLRLANRVVREFLEGTRQMIPRI